MLITDSTTKTKTPEKSLVTAAALPTVFECRLGFKYALAEDRPKTARQWLEIMHDAIKRERGES